jgi:hypothetical protein
VIIIICISVQNLKFNFELEKPEGSVRETGTELFIEDDSFLGYTAM